MFAAVFWRVALVQAVGVVVLSLLLGVLLPQSFFEDWGWLTGPLAWLACARFTAWAVGLRPEPVLVRALLAGIASLLLVLLGLHWLGALVAVGLLAALCAMSFGRVAGLSS